MTVVRPNSIAGINSITVQTGQALNIHDASGNLIRNITSSSGISTFASVEIAKGTGDLKVGVSTFFVDQSTGKIGIGTAVPAGLLEIDAASTTEMIMLDVAGVNFAKIGHNAASGVNVLDVRSEGHMRLLTGGNNERLRIDSSGRLLLGTTAFNGTYDGINPHVLLEGTSYDTSTVTLFCNANAAGTAPQLQLGKSRGTSDGATTILQDDDRIGSIWIVGADGTDRNSAFAGIDFKVDGTPGANDTPGRIEFKTTSDGASTPTERLRIDSSGRIKIGTDSAAATNEAVTIKGDSGGDCFISLRSNAHADGNDQQIRFMLGDAIGSSGNICSSISSEITDTSSGTLKANLVISANRGDATTNRYIIYGDGTVDHLFKTKTAADLFKLHNSGLVEIVDGDLKVASGHGIDFSAGTGHSGTGGEVLTDFEYGTWTPTLYFLSNNGGITYTTQQGDYTKVGNRVFFSFSIEVNSIGSSAGNVLVWGLPYNVNQPTNGVNAPSSVSLFPISKLNITGDAFCGQLTSQPDIELYRVTWGTGNNYSALQASQIADGFFLKGQGHYCTDS